MWIYPKALARENVVKVKKVFFCIEHFSLDIVRNCIKMFTVVLRSVPGGGVSQFFDVSF